MSWQWLARGARSSRAHDRSLERGRRHTRDNLLARVTRGRVCAVSARAHAARPSRARPGRGAPNTQHCATYTESVIAGGRYYYRY
eukprot:3697442-Prymnesium_polylepis.1